MYDTRVSLGVWSGTDAIAPEPGQLRAHEYLMLQDNILAGVDGVSCYKSP